MRFEGKDIHPNSHTRSLEQLMRAVDYALGLVAWKLLYRLRHTECVTLVDRSGREVEETHRKENTARLHWVRWEPAELRYDDTEDAAIGTNGQDYPRCFCSAPSCAAKSRRMLQMMRHCGSVHESVQITGPNGHKLTLHSSNARHLDFRCLIGRKKLLSTISAAIEGGPEACNMYT